jgi:hypothetical protein
VHAPSIRLRGWEKFESHAAGYGNSVRLPWRRKNSRLPTSVKDVSELEAEDDPRGGLQSQSYRHADPRELVEENGTVMAGPGGAPQEGESVEERHRRNVRWRRKHWYRRSRASRV